MSGRTRLSLNTRIGDQNLYGPRPSVKNMYALSNLNTRVGDQNLCDPEPSIKNDNVGNDLRSVVIGMNPLPVQSGEVSFWGEVDGQSLCGQSP